MSSPEALDRLLFSLSRAFCTPFSVFIQIQGCVICLLLGIGWALAASVRNREINRIKHNMRNGNNFAFLCHNINELEHSNQVNLPTVTVIMPLKGFGEHNLRNWRSQITSLYGGPLEFIFVVDSTEDPAYHAVSRLVSEYEDHVDAKIIVADFATTCSQKIHNQLVGVENMRKDSKYVLFLDDDVRLHPGTIGELTKEMEKNPNIFIQTGYPLDLPSGSLGSYCIYEYHMVSNCNFRSISNHFYAFPPIGIGLCALCIFLKAMFNGLCNWWKNFFLWGGCMMMHADDFRKDRCGVVSGLRYGGYSDDMTLAAIAGAHKELIYSPPVAVFPHPLASDLNFGRYWNYLRKQTFVLESYVTRTNWIMNRVLFVAHCYLSWGFVTPYVMAIIHVVAALRFFVKGYSYEEMAYGLSLVGFLIVCTFVALSSMWNLTRIEVHLCNLLSPEAPRLSLASYNWCLVFTAMMVGNFLYPISAVRSRLSQYINWSGILYYLEDGKVCRIERVPRSKDMRPVFTDLGGKHLFGKKGLTRRNSFIGFWSSLAQCRQPKKHA